MSFLYAFDWRGMCFARLAFLGQKPGFFEKPDFFSPSSTATTRCPASGSVDTLVQFDTLDTQLIVRNSYGRIAGPLPLPCE